MGSELVKPHHLSRKAVIYVRQSTPHQVLTNQESLRLQYALRERAHELGWSEAEIDVIDADLGLSGAAASHRQGFKDLVSRVTLDEVGIILSLEVTRLARNCSDWYPLLDVCGYRECLIADRDGVYDPGTATRSARAARSPRWISWSALNSPPKTVGMSSRLDRIL
ncbi:recombinase family protein [Azospirillum argentinense]